MKFSFRLGISLQVARNVIFISHKNSLQFEILVSDSGFLLYIGLKIIGKSYFFKDNWFIFRKYTFYLMKNELHISRKNLFKYKIPLQIDFPWIENKIFVSNQTKIFASNWNFSLHIARKFASYRPKIRFIRPKIRFIVQGIINRKFSFMHMENSPHIRIK